MIINCQKCKTKFRLNDELIKEDGSKVRCSVCKDVFTVYPDEIVIELNKINRQEEQNIEPQQADPQGDFITEDEFAVMLNKPDYDSIKEEISRTNKKPASRILITLAVLVFLAGAIFGSYTFFDNMNIRIPYISDLLDSEKAPNIGSAKISAFDIEARFTENRSAGQIFVITGTARNDYPEARSYIKLRVKLFTKGKVLAKQETIACGNLLSESELSFMTEEEIDKYLQNPAGSGNVNINIKPHKMIPFMAVFFNLPKDLDEYAVEALSSVPSVKN